MRISTLLLCLLITTIASGQTADTTSARGEYPYFLPILGKKAHDRGYKLQLPHGVSLGTIFTKQALILENFQFAFTGEGEEPDFEKFQPLADLIVFGPSEGRINTINVRFDTWVLPFFSIGGYYGRVWGEQTITLTAPIEISSVTDIEGQYYGLNLLAVAPVGPVVLAGDYSWSWTTNVRLDKPVRVKVAGLRVIKRFLSKKRDDRFWAVWVGTQYQNLASQTSGNIPLDEALDITDKNIEDLDMAWEDYKMSAEWEDLSPGEMIKYELAYQATREALEKLTETTVYYKFDKRLEKNWNLMFGGNFQINDRFQIRAEYGALKGKQQLMVQGTYRFGI